MIVSIQWLKIYTEQIVPMIGLDKAASQQNPTLIVVGAQPGAGKSAEVQRAANGLCDSVVINGDQFRPFHPDYEAFLKESTATAAERTSDAVGFWVSRALDDARARKCSVVMETTLRQPQLLSDTLRKYQSAGYKIHLRVLIVPDELSFLGIHQRYLAAASVAGIAPRYSLRCYHDDALRNQEQTIEALAPHLVSITFVDRTGNSLDSFTASSSDWRPALLRLRAENLKSVQRESLCDDWKAVESGLLECKAPQEILDAARTETEQHCT